MILPQVRIFRHYVSRASIILMALETALLFGVMHIGLTTQTSAQDFGDTVFSYFGVAATALFILVFASLGLYNRHVIANIQVMVVRLLVGLLIVTLLMYLSVKFYLWLNPSSVYPPRRYFYLPFAILLGVALLLGLRILFLYVADLDLLRQRIFVVGDPQRFAPLQQEVFGDRAFGFDIVRTVDPGELVDAPDGKLLEQVRRVGADEIVVDSDRQPELPSRQLLDCKMSGLRVTDYLTFVERELGRIDLRELDPAWLVFSDGFNIGMLSNAAVRLFDIAASLVLIVFTLPIIVVTALLVKLDSPGDVLYRQERVGLNGAVFRLVKFRSMRSDAEASAGPRWAGVNDDRVTRVGRFIRMTRIDELPQVFNVLRGEMSLVGPRPERPYFVETLSRAIPYYPERHRVKPGITGWAQINYPYGASIEDAREKLSYDLYYVKNRSLFLNALILLQTVKVVLWPAGVR
jgi:sugar transferase (PEP-CTERM system associated)